MRPPKGLNFRVATQRMPKSCARCARPLETTIPNYQAELQYWSHARPILGKRKNLKKLKSALAPLYSPIPWIHGHDYK